MLPSPPPAPPPLLLALLHWVQFSLGWYYNPSPNPPSPPRSSCCARFQNIDNVINALVVEDPDSPGSLTDVVSFYTLPSSILGHPQHTELKAAYLYYTASTATPLKQLVNDAMAVAAARGYDVFNALDLMQNESFLKELKFGMGDGQLHYYLYNWRLGGGHSLQPGDVGLVLM